MLLSDQVTNEIDQAINLMNKGQPDLAVQAFTTILTKHGDIPLVWNNRGLALLQLGHPFDAVMNIEKAIALEPKTGEYYMNMGACYAEYEQMDKAVNCYRESLKLNPKIAQTHMNIGNVLKWQGKAAEAITYYRECTKCDPTYVDGHLVRAFGELALGNYKEGWEEFEWRWKSNQLVPRGLEIPQWEGEPLEGKTLLIYGEQGHGDSLQFMRYAPLVKRKYGCTVFVEVRQPLTRLMQTMELVDKVITYGEQVPVTEIDYMIPVMSLPRIFGTTVETIPWYGPYYKADPYRMGLWKEKLKDLPPGMLIGVCWAGLSRPGKPQADAIDRRRSTTLDMFSSMAKIPNISWVSLQKGTPRDQVMKPPVGMTIGDWSEEFDDFYDTAALIENLDLVITVDTAVVHLAAALGKPTWLLSRWDGCWRWFGDRADSPWYPTLRQFTQPAPHAWQPMMDTVALALREYVKEFNKKAA